MRATVDMPELVGAVSIMLGYLYFFDECSGEVVFLSNDGVHKANATLEDIIKREGIYPVYRGTVIKLKL
jgi:hypothetical protein